MRKSHLLIALIYAFISLHVSAQTDFEGTWKGELVNEFGYEWSTVLHLGYENDSMKARISFPDWGMYRLATDSILVSENGISLKVLWLDADFSAELFGNVLQIRLTNWHTASGRMHRSSDSPNFLRRESISYLANDGKTLKGTVVLPDGEPPYVGMVLTHGSGPDTRHTGPYIGKAHLAVEEGMAVLIYDKRGAGESEGSQFNTLDRLSKDAHGMVQILRNHTLIDADKVGIGGISQGAWIAPKVAYEDSTIAFVFSTATPGVTSAEQNVYTLETRIEGQGERQYAKVALRKLYEFYRTNDHEVRGEAVSLIENEKYKLYENEIFRRLMFIGDSPIPEDVDPGFWANAMFEDPLVWWSEIKVPVASFSGEDDKNVPTVFSNKLIEAALQDASNDDYELHLYPNAGHGLTLEYAPGEDWPRMAVGYVEMMGAWFQRISSDLTATTDRGN